MKKEHCCWNNECCSYAENEYLSMYARLEDTVPGTMRLQMYNPLTDGIEEKTIADYKWKWLVLFFYPADFTFVCPTELKDLQKRYEEIKAMGDVEVLAVSVDSVFSHKGWIATEPLLKDFSFCMVADRTRELATYFDVINNVSGHTERGTFIISPDGVIKMIELNTDAVWRSAKELVRKLSGLKFVAENSWQACPASWENDMPTLRPSIKSAGHAEEAMK